MTHTNQTSSKNMNWAYLVLPIALLSGCGKSVKISGPADNSNASTVSGGGPSIVVLATPTPSPTPVGATPTPTPTPSPVASTGDIHCKVYDLYTYYPTHGLTGAFLPDYSALVEVADITLNQFNVPSTDWSLSYPDFPSSLKYLTEWYGMSCQGYFEAPSTGNYLFQTNTDDGSKFYVDSQLIVDGDGEHPPTLLSNNVVLAAGIHSFQMDWFQGPRVLIALQLSWKVPTASSLTVMPASAFTHY